MAAGHLWDGDVDILLRDHDDGDDDDDDDDGR